MLLARRAIIGDYSAMILFFNSLEQVVILSLSVVLGLMLFDMLVMIPYLRDRLSSEIARLFSGRLSSAAFVFLAVWKLSPVVLRFSDVISRPILLLYAPGGPIGGIAGLIAAGLFMAPLLPQGRLLWERVGEQKKPVLAVNVTLMIALVIVVYFAAGAAFDAYNASRLGLRSL